MGEAKALQKRTAEQMVKLKDPQLLATFDYHRTKYVDSSALP